MPTPHAIKILPPLLSALMQHPLTIIISFLLAENRICFSLTCTTAHSKPIPKSYGESQLVKLSSLTSAPGGAQGFRSQPAHTIVQTMDLYTRMVNKANLSSLTQTHPREVR
ncbi:MAG: hypothetical protein K0S27_877 [Gammaproteobacteria bacterium]|jgi:hypothetical protein|nr:hypothetical protein [Gammaproteobacteria bacterium]